MDPTDLILLTMLLVYIVTAVLLRRAFALVPAPCDAKKPAPPTRVPECCLDSLAFHNTKPGQWWACTCGTLWLRDNNISRRVLIPGCKRCGAPKQPWQEYCGAACSAQRKERP